MRILIVSFYFPPANTMGSIAVAETVKHLRRAGDEVEVLTAVDGHPVRNLDVTGLDEVIVHRTAWWDVNRPLRRARTGPDGQTTPGHAVEIDGWRRVAASGYRNVVHLPDSKVGWLPRAIRAGRSVVDRFQPDVILSSGPPATGHLIGAALARHARTTRPTAWCAHFRDPWSGNALSSSTEVRRRLDERWQRRTLTPASLVLANDGGHAQRLGAELGREVIHWPNAFDEDDYVGHDRIVDRSTIELVHTGSVYRDAQHIEPLLRALASHDGRGRPVHVTFYGSGLDHVARAALDHGVSHLVAVHPPISKAEAARRQMDAAALLLFSPTDDDWLLGKVFAYAGARRPIWAIGPTTNATSRLVLRDRLGELLDSETSVSRALRGLCETGPAPDLPSDTIAHLTRGTRVAELRALLESAEPRSNQSRPGQPRRRAPLTGVGR